MSDGHPRCLYSFVIDEAPIFAYQGWHLAHSLQHYCGAAPEDIHVQCTPEVDTSARSAFDKVGFQTTTLQRFGDGKYCNKIAQFDQIDAQRGDVVVLLDTDTIAVADLRQWVSRETILGKIVDLENPPLPVLQEIAAFAKLPSTGRVCSTDSGGGVTFEGNCNGGMYAIPGAWVSDVAREWKRWARWLLDNGEPLERAQRQAHADQVSFWMALRSSGMPFTPAPSNMNYFVHFDAPRAYFDPSREIALIHYHNATLDAVGKIDPPAQSEPIAHEAIARANEQIGRSFNNALFWNYRYTHWPDRGSGVGSRGENLTYKRELLRSEGIEQALSVLDVGCGDLETVKDLALNQYVGVDLAPIIIERACAVMPSGNFQLGMHDELPSSDFVLCLEVLIHQSTIEEYDRVIDFVARRTKHTLIISGYQSGSESIKRNAMVFFHEALESSLKRSGRFSSIRQIGAHTDVCIFRCDV